MRRLMLLRHAKADTPDSVQDHDRPLALRGRRQCKAMGEYLRSQGLIPDLVVVSTARRAQETWKLVCESFAKPISRQNETRIYEATTDTLLEVIRETAASVHVLLLVGHNPGFERLAASLTGSGKASAIGRLEQEYPTAGLAVIDFGMCDWTEIKAGQGHLERFETLATIDA
ncbi:histidine phosphatase family protein [Alcaligenaceae bacterium]|nr:histidine phosphatase family protein [Alcaligenaceae bacterium]